MLDRRMLDRRLLGGLLSYGRLSFGLLLDRLPLNGRLFWRVGRRGRTAQQGL